MNIQALTIAPDALRKLLGCCSGDAALLYLYLTAGNGPEQAAQALHMTEDRYTCAAALLRQLGLYTQPKATFVPGERPAYSETDVMCAMNGDTDFKTLYGEVQRLLGRTLNTEELKILLGFNRYLGLPNEVISVLVCWCKERNRQRGNLRNPSLRSIEKEAYFWAEQGIDSLEEAAAFIRARNLKNSRTEKLKAMLQIRGRNLTSGEQRYADSWLDMGFEDAVLAEAYERTCLNTGSLNWPYMNRILTRWHEAGLHTMDAIKQGDRKDIPKGASGKLGQAELEALARILQED